MDLRDREMSVIVPNLAILLFVALGLMSDRPQLRTARPRGEPEKDSVTTSGSMGARLWQDPLGVIGHAEAALARPARGRPLDGRIDQAGRVKQEGLNERNGRASDAIEGATPAPRILLLGVLVSGGGYPEDVEVRLRTRNAVLSALGRAQYVPTEKNRIGLIHAVTPGLVVDVPFEEFAVRYIIADGVEMPAHENYWRPSGIERRDVSSEEFPTLVFDEPYDRVVVLWLNETVLGARASGGVDPGRALLPRRIDAVVSACVSDHYDDRCSLAIIGPTSTDALLDFVERAGAASPLRWKAARVFSPRATAADAVVQISSTRQPEFAAFSLVDHTGDPRERPLWPVERTIATDDRLVIELLAELGRRKATPNRRNHVVLVGEWDSLYSRGLARTFAARLVTRPGKLGGYGLAITQREAWSINPPYLHEFSYLRGLDGSTDANRDDGDARPERAEGRSQYDYLRRLEQQLVNLRNRLRRGDDMDQDGHADVPSDITAIGVVGSDVYDKLLVLRALRASFDRAIFFTTDMDALYFDPAERESARNLLVVSPFGLSASATLQGRIPPFRDSYQTALFLTTLKALGLEKVGAEDFALTSGAVAPRVFEVGRSGAHSLSVVPEKGESILVHPEPDAHFHGRWKPEFWIPATLLLGVLLLYAQGWTLRRVADREGARARVRLVPRDEVARHSLIEALHGLVWVTALVGLVSEVAARRGDSSALTLNAMAARASALFVVVIGCGILFSRSRLLLVPAAEVCPVAAPPPAKVKLHPIELVLILGLLITGIGLLIANVMRAGAAGEEPLYWFEGVSVWPTEFVRGFAIVIGVCFIVQVRSRLVGCARDIQERLRSRAAPAVARGPTAAQSRVRRVWTLQAVRKAIFESFEDTRFEGLGAEEIWGRFLRAVRFRSYFPRVFVYILIYILIFVFAGGIFGLPLVPARGRASFALDQGVLAGAVFVHVYLLFYVFDLTMVCCRMIRRVSAIAADTADVAVAVAPIHLVADLACLVCRFIYYPFTVLFIFIVSRNSLFDAWDWPIVLIGVFGSGLLVLIVATTTLQTRAREAKLAAIERIDAQMALDLELAAKGNAPGDPVAKARLEWLRHARSRIEALDGAVFQSWYKNPLYRAAMIPLGGIGSVSALENVVSRIGS